MMGSRREELTARPRSVIPGRQRWDIGVVLGRPRAAEFLEAELREFSGVEQVCVNPLTGRLLLYHDTALSSTKVDQFVRDAVRAVRQAVTRAESSRPEPGVVPVREHRHHAGPALALTTGSAAAAVALVSGKLLRPSLVTHQSAVVRLGAVLVATVAVIRRAWRRARGSQQASTAPLEVPLRSIRHPLLRIVGSRKRQFYLASFLSIFTQLLEMALFLLVGWILSVLSSGASASLVSLGLAGVSGQLWFLAGAAALVCVILVALAFKSGVLWRNLAQSVQHGWRTEMYAHVQRVELRYLEGERTTRIARVLTEDIGQLGRFFATSANDLLQLVASFLVLIPVFLFFAPSIAWIAFLPVPVIVWLSFFNQERAAPDYASSSEDGSLLNSQLINNLEASTTVKSFSAEEYETDRIRRLSEAYLLSNRRIDRRASAYGQMVRGCAMLSLVGILLGGGLDVLSGALQFESFNGLIGLPGLVLWKLPGFGNAVDQYQQTVAALRRVLDLRSLPVESGATGRHLEVAKVEGEMVLDGVTFGYPGRPPVLQNLSLRIAAKQTTGIVGVTGAGKTTLAKLLLRFQDVESGRVLVDGCDVREVRLQDLRNAIAFVGQDAFLFDGTVGDNIRYGTFDADSERVVTAARLAEADSFVEALPSQYDTMIGERGATLSGGQKQRVSLARAILKSAPIVILDEATSALDNETEAAIQRALKDYARDRTLVIIAHRLSTIRHADWIYVMDKGGVIVEGGTHHDLLQRDGVYAFLWRLQTGEANS